MADQPTPETTKTPGASGDTPILVWDAKEYAEYDRNRRWYLLVGLGAVVAILLLILGQAFLLRPAAGAGSFVPEWLEYGLLVLVFSLTAFVVLRHADDPPRTITYAITKLGLQAGDRFYPYNELRSFWIIYKPPVQNLHLQSTNRFRSLLRADLAAVDPLKVREVLKDYLPEETKRTEDFLDKFSRLIRL